MLSKSRKEKLFSLADIIHRRFFGDKMSGQMKNFLGSLSWSFFGGIIAAGILFVISIFAGRYLGPEEYGKYSLITALAGILTLPMLAGLDTSLVHFLSKYSEKRKEYVASGLWLVVLLVMSISGLLFFLAPYLVELFGTRTSLFYIAIVATVILAIRSILDAIVRGHHDFRYQSWVRMLESFVVLVVFVSGYFIGQSTYLVMVEAILFGYFVTICMYVWRYHFLFGFQVNHTRTLLTYGKFVFLGFIFTATMSSLDKVFINKYIGAAELGLYNAYYTVSTLLIGQVIVLLINVVFPLLSSTVDNEGLLLKKVNKIFFIIASPMVFILAIVTRVGIGFFGTEYSVNWVFIALFSIYGYLLMYSSILWSLIASRSQRGFRFTSSNGLIASLIFVGVVISCRNFLSIQIVLISLILSVLYTVLIGNMGYSKYAKIKDN